MMNCLNKLCLLKRKAILFISNTQYFFFLFLMISFMNLNNKWDVLLTQNLRVVKKKKKMIIVARMLNVI